MSKVDKTLGYQWASILIRFNRHCLIVARGRAEGKNNVGSCGFQLGKTLLRMCPSARHQQTLAVTIQGRHHVPRDAFSVLIPGGRGVLEVFVW